MHKNNLNGNNEKISKAIELAVSYKYHRKSIENIKAAIGMPSVHNIKKVDTLTTNRIRYAQQSRKNKQTGITKQNESYHKRIDNTKSQYKTSRNPQVINASRINSSQISKSKSKSRLDSRSSLHSCDSQRSICSNFMSRTRRQKQISNQNIKMAKRLYNPKISRDMRVKQWDKSYAKEQQYMRIRSRFSERSKSIMQSLMLDSLKFDKRNLQFLPQISSPRGNRVSTIGISKTSFEKNNQESQKHLKTLQFAKNLRQGIKKQKKNYYY